MDQKETEVGTCASCGETVYEYEGQVDARSHPRMAMEVETHDGVVDGVLMCAVCYNDQDRYEEVLGRST